MIVGIALCQITFLHVYSQTQWDHDVKLLLLFSLFESAIVKVSNTITNMNFNLKWHINLDLFLEVYFLWIIDKGRQ